MRRPLSTLMLLSGAAVCLAACATLLGLDDVQYTPADAASPTADSALDGNGPDDGGARDGATSCGDADACAPCICPADASCASTCAAVVADRGAPIGSIAAGGGYLYWIEASNSYYTLYRSPADGSPPVVGMHSVNVAGETLHSVIAAGARFFFVHGSSGGGLTSGELLACSHATGCNGNPTYLGGGTELGAFAADDRYALWTWIVDPQGTPSATMEFTELTDGSVRSLRLPPASTPTRVALASPYAYWFDNSYMWRQTLGADAAPSSPLAAFSAGSIASGHAYVYWFDANVVQRCALEAGSCQNPETVGTNTGVNHVMVVDDRAVYWIGEGPQGVDLYRWKNGSLQVPREHVAHVQGNLGGGAVAVDQTHVYFTETTDAGTRILRLPK